MMTTRLYTTKQMGDACEMLVAAELTLRGVPAMKMPDNWPCYDVIAQPEGGGAAQRISVKSRTFKRGGGTFVSYDTSDNFDWLAIVLLPGDGETSRRFFVVPKGVADQRARKYNPLSKVSNLREWRVDEVAKMLKEFEDNFRLSLIGGVPSPLLE